MSGEGKRVYRPRLQASLDRRLREFFLCNPGEELSPEDAMQKFGTCRSSLMNALSRLRKAGVLESPHIIRMTPEAKAKASQVLPIEQPLPAAKSLQVPVFNARQKGAL